MVLTKAKENEVLYKLSYYGISKKGIKEWHRYNRAKILEKQRIFRENNVVTLKKSNLLVEAFKQTGTDTLYLSHGDDGAQIQLLAAYIASDIQIKYLEFHYNSPDQLDYEVLKSITNFISHKAENLESIVIKANYICYFNMKYSTDAEYNNVRTKDFNDFIDALIKAKPSYLDLSQSFIINQTIVDNIPIPITPALKIKELIISLCTIEPESTKPAIILQLFSNKIFSFNHELYPCKIRHVNTILDTFIENNIPLTQSDIPIEYIETYGSEAHKKHFLHNTE